ncbi:MAG TPA: DUF2911 domain-containing protein [Gemmatimonadaceae bacterium]|nr:DUF2911 domain-containing protein [Gemmatimonadaceae bacterium]
MRSHYAVLLLLAIGCASSPRETDSPSLAASGAADMGTFVVTLGRDTIAAERFRFGRGRIDGEVVTRLRETVRRPYAIVFDNDGNPVRLEFSTRRPTDTPTSPPLQTATITLVRDTIVMETRRNDSTVIRRVPAPPGTVPLLGQSYASYAILTRRAARSGPDSVQIPTWAVGAQRTDLFSVVRVNADTMKIVAPFGTMYARVDADGRILGAQALSSTFKVVVTRGPMTDLTAIAMMAAIPQLSPRDTLRTSIAGAAFTLTYSRPMKRGRVVFGGMVPWGEVWRTGANEATHFHTDKDLVIGDTTIPAGTYTLWTIPRPDGWTLIINKQTGQWGTIYDPAQDLARVEMHVEPLADTAEQFTISVEPMEDGAVLRLKWDDREAWVPIEIK